MRSLCGRPAEPCQVRESRDQTGDPIRPSSPSSKQEAKAAADRKAKADKLRHPLRRPPGRREARAGSGDQGGPAEADL